MNKHFFQNHETYDCCNNCNKKNMNNCTFPISKYKQDNNNFTYNSSKDTETLRGPMGPMGFTGPRGLTGPQGPIGETGPVSAHLVILQLS